MIVVTLLTMDLVITPAWEASLRNEIESSLSQKTAMFAARVEANHGSPLQSIAEQEAHLAGARATIIDRSGRVLADSEADPATMENHAGRPEVRQALAGSVGSDVRLSHTVGVDFLYVAVPTEHEVVRLAYPLSVLKQTTREVRRRMLVASIGAFLLATLLAALLSQFLTRRLKRILQFADRIAEGDLSARLTENSSDEIGQVASALNATAKRLENSFGQLEDSHRELQAVLDSMQEGVIAVSRDGRAEWANRQMSRLLPTGVRLGAPVVETVRDPEFVQLLQQITTSRHVATCRALSIVPGRVFNVTAAPMPAGASLFVLHDLTEIERVEKTRRDFIANVSHELRTPLTSIQGYAETLLDTATEESTREFLEIIRKNAARMTRLTEDLLILARVESGEHKPRLQPLAASELLHDAEQYFREHQAECGLELCVNTSALKLVNADRDQIFQVFTNLIDNACKYAAEGKRIEIGAHDIEGFVEFYVRDFGPGISSEHLTRLFERFYRIEKARSRESGGTGLGLAIAKHIVRAHGGDISAISELHHGSTFEFTLPEARQAMSE
jgi:two-component system phosphate regulon sensor histidine kinase PhoR